MTQLEQTERTTIRRGERASYEFDDACAILDEALIAHVGFVVDGQPYVIPMAFGRDGDRVLVHGGVASRLSRRLAEGLAVCVTVTLLDGLVLARSQFHHSMNYRSVVILGTATKLEGAEADAALVRITDHIVAGRSAEARPGNRVENRQTVVLSIPIAEASVKCRRGGPLDDDEDIAAGGWAGVIPVETTFGAPVGDEYSSDVELPASVLGYRRPV